jgi:hypothetical protein
MIAVVTLCLQLLTAHCNTDDMNRLKSKDRVGHDIFQIESTTSSISNSKSGAIARLDIASLLKSAKRLLERKRRYMSSDHTKMHYRCRRCQ